MSSGQGPSSKARGRARGRARGQPTEAARRPGEEKEAPQQRASQAQAATGVSGRASHRGGARGDPRPGEHPQPPVSEMAALQIGESDQAGRGARGRREPESLKTRPEHVANKKGKSGNPLTVIANYFKVETIPDWVIYQYHVDFSPSVESPRMRRALLCIHKEQLGSCYLFDGMSDLKTLSRLATEPTQLYSQRKTDGENICITLKRTAELPPRHPEVLRLFNTQNRRNLQHLKFQLLGQHYFDPQTVSAIPQHGIELWQGVITAIRQHENSVMMVVDTTYKVLRRDTVYDLMYELRKSHNYTDECTKQIAGSVVMTRYNNKTYRVDDIAWKKTPRDTFETKSGPLTYMDYYLKHYEIRIKDQKQPLLVCQPSKRDLRAGRTQNIYLIPELCCLTGLTEAMRSDFNVMRDLAAYTRLPPNKRVENLSTFIQRVKSNSEVRKDMRGWGMEFSNSLVEVQARVLNTERIIQVEQPSSYDPKTADFSREMRGKPMELCRDLRIWTVIVSRRDYPKFEDFLQSLKRVCPPMGMRVNNPEVITIEDDRINSFIGAMRRGIGPETEMILIIVPNNRKDRYDAIKKVACIDIPVPSQVVVARTLSKKQMLMSVATKIGVQLNCKMGGVPWRLEIPLFNLMVIGYDTYHDSSQKGRSAGGFVASLNKNLTQWYSRVAFHNTHQELSDALKVHITVALKRYSEVNGSLPDRIIFYRDGVSDGQIHQVQEWELEQLRRSYRELAPDYTPRFAFVVVTKRISTRFFMKGSRQFENPPPGTVIDDEVTRPERYDFYLVSQSVRQGTVTPTQYNVIYDTSSLSPDHMQRLSYKLTHLYYNWPGTIRVPAPCQYAHKLAFLAGQSLHREPSPVLSNYLFYL